jgi:hypothetical protein
MKTKKEVGITMPQMAHDVANKRMRLFVHHYQLDRPFLRGIGNVLDIFATTYDLDFTTKSDRAVLMSDVQNVGDDMRMSISQLYH